jgi:hypothetical protein
MLKVVFALFVLTSVGLAQSPSDGSFSVHYSKHANSSLNSSQMREAESLYQSACEVVRHDFHGVAGKLHPHFTLVIGADRNEVRGDKVQGNQVPGNAEIWMKKWNPTLFAQGVVVVAFNELLTPDLIMELGNRAVRYNNATVGVAELK